MSKIENHPLLRGCAGIPGLVHQAANKVPNIKHMSYDNVYSINTCIIV